MNQQLSVERIPDPKEGETEEETIADLKEALQAYVDTFGAVEGLTQYGDIECPTR